MVARISQAAGLRQQQIEASLYFSPAQNIGCDVVVRRRFFAVSGGAKFALFRERVRSSGAF
jgi:hypothetical protein